VREHLPDATIAVVDGKYSTWPSDENNSTDRTPTLARELADEYYADGPFEDEQAKHRHRVNLAPDGEQALFLDTDERILKAELDSLPRGIAYQPRIINPLVYSQTPVRYWPRIFDPANVADIQSWDKYLFSTECKSTDDVTIVHRHDLRGRDYREAKYERFDAEGRAGRFEDGRFDQYLTDDWKADPGWECPECGENSIMVSPWTGYSEDGSISRARVCVNGECWMITEVDTIDEYRYLPDNIDSGMNEDQDRLRKELLTVGSDLIAMYPVDKFEPEILEHRVRKLADWPTEMEVPTQ
jgi:hypothetical protein